MKALAALLFAGTLGVVWAPGVRAWEADFDQGVDASAALEAARREAGAAHGPFRHRRYSVDCMDFVFKPDSPIVSQRVTLRSTEWIDHCHGHNGDRPHDDYGRHPHCLVIPGRTYSESVQVSLRERKPLLPWESDTFRVCLEGPWLRSDPVATAYEYTRGPNTGRGDFLYVPGRKTPMRPDPAGLAVGAFSPSLVLRLEDKWASHYAGEKLALQLFLVQEWGILRPPVLETTIYLPTAAVHEIKLMDYSQYFKMPVQPGSRYHLKFNFQRVGTVSKPDTVPSWGYLGAIRTPTVEYRPGSEP